LAEPTRVYGRRLTSILVEAGVVTSEQVDAGLSRQRTTGRKIGESLVEMGVATEEDIGWALAHQLDLTFVDLSLEALDHELVHSFPEGMLERLEAVPLVVSEPTLTIALADPLDQEIVAELERAAGRPLSLAIATPSAIRRVLRAVLGLRRSQRARPVPAEHLDERRERSGPGFLASLLADARRAGASEIHFLPRRGEIEVHHRVGRALVRVGSETPDALDHLVIHLEKLGGPVADDRAIHAAGRIVCPVGAEAIELGISLLRQDEGTSLTLEVAPVTTRPPVLDELGFDPLDLASLRAALDTPAGLGVVAGPPRSGGSTTLACLFAETEVPGRRCLSFAPRPHRVATDTRSAGPAADAGATWAEAAVAQCADLVTLDGVLEGDAIGAALSSRAAGRLVLLRTDWTDSFALLERLAARPGDREALAARLRFVVQQRLLRRDGADEPPHAAGPRPDRCAAFEVLIVSDTLRQAIRAGEPAARLRARAEQEGFRPLVARVQALVDAGWVSAAEAARVLA